MSCSNRQRSLTRTHLDSRRSFRLKPAVGAVLVVVLAAGPAWGQEPATTPPSTTATQTDTEWVAEVSGNDVYVRSGPSTNHYPVVKLNAGSKVTIVGREAPWYEIKPPAEAQSLIHENYVDTVNDKDGVVNGDNVRVRAVSNLAEFSKRRSKVQTKLSKGATVTILGKTDDGFLRIAPPAGVTLWVHEDFIAQLPPSAPTTPAAQLDSTLIPSTQPATELTVGETSEQPTLEAPKSPLTAVDATAQRKTLEAIDADARAELAQPVSERNFQPLIARYQALVEQEEDTFASEYAAKRVRQLTYLAEVAESSQRMRDLLENIEDQRREFIEARANLPAVVPPIPGGFDAQGEMRISAAYPPGARPERYRLIDPGTDGGLTIGYLEIPPSSKICAADFIGRYVGVRASQRKRLHGVTADIIPVFVVSELVALQPATRAETAPQGKDK